VREQFLCQHVPPPPPGVDTNLPVLDEARPLTNRERLAAHTTNKSCAGCHSLIDPIGFGLEKYDAIGMYREKQKLMFFPEYHGGPKKPKAREIDLALDTSGQVAGLPDALFSSPRELGELLARTQQCQECMVKQVFRYMTGRLDTRSDVPVLRNALEEFRSSGFRFKALVVSLVRQWDFQPRESTVNVASDHETR
jgi:hypothetical protein